METSSHRVDWEALWSREARQKQLPSLHGIVSRYTKEPDVIPMHGGLPPANTFPFTSFTCGLLPLSDASNSSSSSSNTINQAPAGAGAAAGDLREGSSAVVQQQQPQKEEQEEGHGVGGSSSSVLAIDDPALVCAAQQYNMHAPGYAPLVAWARDLVTSLHKPATLLQQHQQQQQQHQQHDQQHHEQHHEAPVGMDVVITPGASAALDSLVRVLVDPGDAVLVEEYTYAHMVEAHLLPLGCELLPVRLDGCGLVPSHLDALLTARQAAGLAMPKLLYTIPTGQNPTGAVMDAERMGQIYALACKWSLIIIEDDAYYWLQYPHGPENVPGLNLRPGFLSLDTDGRVVRVDTLAKLLGPGFRLGWLSGPPPLVAKLGLYMAGISIGANMVSQVMLHELLAKTWGRSGFESFIKRLQAQYARQAAVAAAAAEEQLAGLAEWQPARAGMFMWFRLTGDTDSECLIEAAAASKVMVVPGHLISVGHLQAAHRRKTAAAAAAAAAVAAASAAAAPRQQQQQQAAVVGFADTPQQEREREGGSSKLSQNHALLQQLEGLAQQLQEQQEQGQEKGAATGDAGGGIACIASQLASISQQLQHLHGLGAAATNNNTVSNSSTSAAAGAGASVPSAGAEVVSAAGAAAAVSLDAHNLNHNNHHHEEPCPFFRVSFVSVPAEVIQEGFVRLRAAILSCHGPKTPPGEESDISSCSSSIGSSVVVVGVVGGGHHLHNSSGSNASCCGGVGGGVSGVCGGGEGAATAEVAAAGGGDSALC